MENSGTIEIIDTSLVSTLVEDAINIDAISVNNDNGKIILVRDLTVDIVVFLLKMKLFQRHIGRINR